jgi:N6-L-threonylcarbamoyladenine synthase
MNILGIETSCDETAAAVVKDGRTVLSNVVYTQIPLHVPYGGVVPEIASRAHVEKISEVVRTAISEAANCGDPDAGKIDAVAVTYGPGLSPALVVGLNAAKGLAKSLGVPLIGINHIEAHLHTPFLVEWGTGNGEWGTGNGDQGTGNGPEDFMPALGLAISGGHTTWVDMPEYGRYNVVGQTLDDAAGEAFDKAAKLLGLGYPGGPKVDKISRQYFEESGASRNDLIPFPKGRPREGVTALAGLPADCCVSFSGLKTALLRYVQQNGGVEALTAAGEVPRIVASYQEAIVQAVADRTRTALKRRGYKAMIVGGGVSLNSRLREVLSETCRRAKVPLLMAKPKFCGDNGAMIAALAYWRRNKSGEAAMLLDVAPSLDFE